MSQRRSLGGARREATERVVLRRAGFEAQAWTLNLSRGGLRVVLEEPVIVGSEYVVLIGAGEERAARVVWVRDEADGQIAGLQFLESGAEGAPGSSSEIPPSNAAAPLAE